MKSKGIIFVFAFVLFMSIGTTTTFGSWVKFSVSDLVQNSDTILIGKIDGPVGESKGVADGITGWVTYWRIEVNYYLKGNQRTKDLYVVTPGAKNKNVSSSNDFRLDEWGSSSILLFLRKDGDSYVPLSPQGIVSIQKTGYSPNFEEPLTGKRILAEFNIINPQTNTKEDFEQFISGSVPVIPSDISASLPLNIQLINRNTNLSKIGVIIGIVASLLIISILFLRYRSRVS